MSPDATDCGLGVLGGDFRDCTFDTTTIKLSTTTGDHDTSTDLVMTNIEGFNSFYPDGILGDFTIATFHVINGVDCPVDEGTV